MMQWPTGTVTFLFTDVAGSSRLWESDPDGMARNLATHDRILREVIRENGGYVFATGGDSFSASFPTAGQAVAAAVAAQLALQDESWERPEIRVRMGVHTGVAEERDGDYFGPAVSRAARVMGLGHGGQIVVSAATAEMLRERLEAPLALIDRGRHRLKGMERPEHLFELRHPDLPAVTEAIVSDDEGLAHLPEPMTSFVGRSVEMAAISDLLDRGRLVTLTGVGGTGKTRLALEVARNRAAGYSHGTWMAELAPVTDPGLVINQVADVWGLRAGEGASLIEVVTAFLESRELLLIVDNCEHVLLAVADLIGRLLTAGHGLTVLATSRESLGVAGEMIFQVPSLGLPGDDSAGESDAVRLFLDRVELVRPGMSPSADEMTAIVRICRRLDGIPLGLELAAARLRSLSPGELADRLEDSFRILTGGARTAMPRQRTLQATIDWSYDLLEPADQTLFRRISVFAGGFDLSAAESVGSGGDVEESEILDLLHQLVDKSLVVASLGEGGTRFRLLEPIRQYAQERLADDADADEVHLSHAAYYATRAHHLEAQLRSSEQVAAHQALMTDLDNIRVTLAELRDHDRYEDFLRMCFDLTWFWAQASMQVEASEVLLPVLESILPGTHPSEPRAWFTMALMAFFLTDPRSVEYADRGLEVARLRNDEMAIGWLSIVKAAAIAGITGAPWEAPRGGQEDDSEEWLEQGALLVRSNLATPWWDTAWDEALLELFRGFAVRGAGQLEAMTKVINSAIAVGDDYLATTGRTMAFFVKDRDGVDAVAELGQAVGRLRELGFRHALGHALIYWGYVTRDQDAEGAGESALSEGAAVLAEVGDIPCSLDGSRWMIESQLEAARTVEARATLAQGARKARLRPESLGSVQLIRLACRVALASDDVRAGALFYAYGQSLADEPGDADLWPCLERLRSTLQVEELEALIAEATQSTPAEMIESIRAWAERPRS